jgi:iron complex transport system substrate-binding protein
MTRFTGWQRTGLLLLSLLATGGCDAGEGAGTGEGIETGQPTEAGEAQDPPSTASPIVVTDDAGRTWSLAAPPERVLSLVPSATLLLLELGHGDLLVGRTEFDTDPRLADLPSVGGGLGPSLEVMLSLRPDLVVRFEGPSDLETPRRLDQAGIPHLALRLDGIEDIFRAAHVLEAAVGAVKAPGTAEAPRSAAELVDGITDELESVALAVAGTQRPRVGILLGGDPPWMASPNTYIGQVVEIAGGDNLFADDTGLYAPISVEEVLRRRPDVLLLIEGARVPTGLRGVPVLRAPASLGLPGPDIGVTARAVARLLHPDRVP